jgi:hypothetical protein
VVITQAVGTTKAENQTDKEMVLVQGSKLQNISKPVNEEVMTQAEGMAKVQIKQKIKSMKRWSWLYRKSVPVKYQSLPMKRECHRLRELLRQQIKLLKKCSWLHLMNMLYRRSRN